VNLGHAVHAPSTSRDVRTLVRREMVNEARRSADLLWAIGRPDELLATMEVIGAEHAVAAVERGRGVVLAGIHMGGWEVATAMPAAVVPTPTSVIVADNWLAWAMKPTRSTAGLRMIYRSAPAMIAARVLARGEALLVMGDDAWGIAPRRHRVRFCGTQADLPAGIVALSRLTGAPMVSFAVLPVGPRRWRAMVHAPIDPPPRRGGDAAEIVALQALADQWTELIRAHPDQWAASFPIAWIDSETPC
jgi:lauroyl/myristoyl acyltransferase